MTEALKADIQLTLSAYTGINTRITGINAASGGCINQCYILTTSQGLFFVKYNLASLYPGMMEAEASGLKLLAAAMVIKVPKVIMRGITGNYSLLVIEYLPPVPPANNFWQQFGQSMAALHRHTQPQYGLDKDNYIGSLPQSNALHTDWTQFFITQRLDVQLVMARDAGLLSNQLTDKFYSLYNRVGELFPSEPASLLHGDLWSGNFISTGKGYAAIIDPAVYYGHREMEIAYTTLFGGFDADFYNGYHEVWPLSPGFHERKDIYNLYPLLVHLNLFGKTYLSQIEEILKPF